MKRFAVAALVFFVWAIIESLSNVVLSNFLTIIGWILASIYFNSRHTTAEIEKLRKEIRESK